MYSSEPNGSDFKLCLNDTLYSLVHLPLVGGNMSPENELISVPQAYGLVKQERVEPASCLSVSFTPSKVPLPHLDLHFYYSASSSAVFCGPLPSPLPRVAPIEMFSLPYD